MEKFTNEAAEKVRGIFESESFKAAFDAIEKAAPEDTGTFEVVITTENLDRYQEVIKLDGWDLTHYNNNPVVLWGHDHNRLIGMATEVTITDGKMIAKGRFAPTEEGQEKRKLYELGFLKATSVGFIEKEREGNLITKAELLEFSFVSVPANPFALSLAMEKELNVNELVTKGIMFVQKDAEPEETKEEDTEEPIEPETTETEPKEDDQPTDEPELTDEQKALAGFIVKEVVAAIKDGALEAAPESEPEGTDDEGDDDDPDVKAFAIKKAMQELDTSLGEYLAELRQQNTHR